MSRPRKHPAELHDNPRFPKFTDAEAMRLYRMSQRIGVAENILIRKAVLLYLEQFEPIYDKLTRGDG